MLIKKESKIKISDKEVEMNVQGSKHSFSRIFPSFLQFTEGVVKNVPNIKDVEIQIDIMKKLGFLLDFDRNSNTLRYSGRKEVAENRVDIGEYSSKHSRSLINLYPIFSRYGVELKEPSGCPIGRRDISWYVDIMNQFGIFVDMNDAQMRVYRSELNRVDEIRIRSRSFSSTNIAITCVIEAQSNTKIYGPSIEPEIFDLIRMLSNAKVNIKYDENEDCIHINASQSDKFKSVDHTILPDRNVIVTLVCGALLLRKDIRLNTLNFDEKLLQLDPFLVILDQLKIRYEISGYSLLVIGSSCNLNGLEIKVKAGHYPLFCSDWQPLIAVLCRLGVNLDIEDTLFESRFGYLDEYKKFGLKYQMINDRRAKIFGSEKTEINPDIKIQANALDLRCGAGIGLLSMLHDGICEISNVVQIKRGYENYEEQLNTLFGQKIFNYE